MHPDELREKLTALHAELSTAGAVDAATRKLLGEVMQDIARLTAAPTTPGTPAAPAAAVATATPDSAAERLEGIAVQFEADHPALAANIRRFVDLLGKVGV